MGFTIDGCVNLYQIELLDTGAILLYEFQLGGYSSIEVLGRVTGFSLQQLSTHKYDERYVFHWSYRHKYNPETKSVVANNWNLPQVTKAINNQLNGKNRDMPKLIRICESMIQKENSSNSFKERLKANKNIKKHTITKPQGSKARRNALRRAMQENYLKMDR